MHLTCRSSPSERRSGGGGRHCDGRRRVRRGQRLLTGAATFCFVCVPASAAVADDPLNRVICREVFRPGCDVHAGTPQAAGMQTTTAGPGRAARRGRAGGAGVERVPTCGTPSGTGGPCSGPGPAFRGADGCYYQPASPSAQVQAALGGPGEGPGGWYEYACSGVTGAGGGLRWVADAARAAVPVDPAAPARLAVSRLDLPALAIGMSPTGPQLVAVPMWLWIEAGSWRPRSATAQVPGVAVTAVARPSRVVWSTGDGSTVTCTGPGTVWTPGGDPAAPSPTCGHTYRRSSSGSPGGTFTVTATVSWDVAWAGGGQGGTVPDLSTVSTVAVTVTDMQAVVNR